MHGPVLAADHGRMHTPSPRNRIRAATIPMGSMRAVNALLAVAAALCILAAAAASIAR
jgi:hypothetical protein